MDSIDYYDILGVSFGDGLPEIQQAFRQQTLHTYRDALHNEVHAYERFVTLCKAYDVLSDPDQRLGLDLFFEYGTPPPDDLWAVDAERYAAEWKTFRQQPTLFIDRLTDQVVHHAVRSVRESATTTGNMLLYGLTGGAAGGILGGVAGAALTDGDLSKVVIETMQSVLFCGGLGFVVGAFGRALAEAQADVGTAERRIERISATIRRQH